MHFFDAPHKSEFLKVWEFGWRSVKPNFFLQVDDTMSGLKHGRSIVRNHDDGFVLFMVPTTCPTK